MVELWTREEMIRNEANAIALVVAVVIAWGIFDWVIGKKAGPGE